MSVLANKTRILVNGYDLSPFLNEVDRSAQVDALDATTFQKTSKVYKAGERDSMLDANGLYDQRSDPGNTADAIDDVIPAALGGPQQIVTVVNEIDSFGSSGYGMLCDLTKYEIKAKFDELVTAGFSMQGSAKDRLVVLHALANEAATGNGNDHDDGAAGMPTSQGAVAYLQAVDLSQVGGDTLTAKVQHSVDGITWVDLVTFDPVTLDHQAQRKEVAAGVSINRHIRAIWTLSAGANATFHVTFARKR